MSMMADLQKICLFNDLYDCMNKKKREKLQNGQRARIDTIVRCSKEYNDNYHEQLASLLETEPDNPIIRIHKSCVSRYTSSTNVQAHIAHVRKCSGIDGDDQESAPKRLRSGPETFDFRKHCLFCPDVSVCILTSEYDPKVPQDRRKSAFLISIAEHANHEEYKQFILDVCSKRNDELGETVRQRVLGAVADLHAADARCHNSCRSKFVSERNVAYCGGKQSPSTDDLAFMYVCKQMLQNRQKTWSSVELFADYVEARGCCMCRKTLLKKLTEYHGENVLVLSSPGFANVIGFKSELAKSLHLVKDTHDDLELALDRVASQITSESLVLKKKTREKYHTNIDKELARESVSDTAALLLSKIAHKFNDSLSQILIGNIITSVVCCQPTDLQIALGVLMRRNKGLISELNKYSVVCSYDEVRLFRYSAAVYVAHNYAEIGFGLSGTGNLIHCVCDNFDCEISSPNCKACCHCLAMIMAQVRLPGNDTDVTVKRKTIPRQRMEDRSKPIMYDVPQVTYDGPKKPPMPSDIALSQVPPLWFLASQNITQRRADENDLAFFQDVITDPECPEYTGYCTRSCREAGLLPAPKTDVSFLPLIDRPPADPDTIKTAIEKGLSLIKGSGQDILYFTCDQQLYKITIDILFHQPGYFKSVVPILGGMHMLMNFIHAIAVVMGGSGLKEVLADTFGSVDKMLSGKKYPQNF